MTEHTIKNKNDALKMIAALSKRFNISLDEISNNLVVTTQNLEPSSDQVCDKDSPSSLIVKLFSYLGAVFILGGIAAFISLYWENLDSPLRVAIFLIPGFSLYLVASLLSGHTVIKKITSPLYVLGYILELSGLYVFLYEYFEHTGRWDKATLFVFGVLLLQQGLTFLSRKDPIVLFCSVTSAVGVLLALFNMAHINENFSVATIGTLLLLCAYFMGKTCFRGVAAGFWYFIGGWMCLGGIFSILENNNMDILVLAPTCFLIFLSTFVKSKSLLFVSIVSLFLFLGYFTAEYFSDSLGWPLLLMILGIILFALSLGGVKLSKRFS